MEASVREGGVVSREAQRASRWGLSQVAVMRRTSGSLSRASASCATAPAEKAGGSLWLYTGLTRQESCDGGAAGELCAWRRRRAECTTVSL